MHNTTKHCQCMLHSWHFLPFGKLMKLECHLGPVQIKNFASLALCCKEGNGSPTSPLETRSVRGPAGQVFQVDMDALVQTLMTPTAIIIMRYQMCCTSILTIYLPRTCCQSWQCPIFQLTTRPLHCLIEITELLAGVLHVVIQGRSLSNRSVF